MKEDTHQSEAPVALFVCRPEFTGTLSDECRAKLSGPITIDTPGPGLVLVTARGTLPPATCIFERQRLIHPGFVPASELKPVADRAVTSVLGSIVSERPLWTVHLVAMDDEEQADTSLSKRLDGIWNTITRLGRKIAPDTEKRFRPPHRLKPGGMVLQLLMTREGLWHSLELIDSMVNLRPGGITRMKWDPLAPSRSFLKMEEALERMPVKPVAGEKVIDLGAAPGGWTYSFLKRGCDVLAVDHGPMKLPDAQPGWGTCRHVTENGITFQPPVEWTPLDWLVGDMLVAPGVALGLLRRWIDSGKARRIVCNIKLPQENPYESIRPVEQMMQYQTSYRYEIVQLYHDRREVTVMAWRD